jgi:hypothetical protein
VPPKSRRRSQKSPYPRELREPLEPRDDPLATLDDEEALLPERRTLLTEFPDLPVPNAAKTGLIDGSDLLFEMSWRPEYDERFGLLCDHFSIRRDDPDRWRKLALALAKTHVPGFQERGPRGAPKKMPSTQEFLLWERFLALARKHKSERAAAEILAKQLNRSNPAQPTSSKALLRRLQRFGAAVNAAWLSKQGSLAETK